MTIKLEVELGREAARIVMLLNRLASSAAPAKPLRTSNSYGGFLSKYGPALEYLSEKGRQTALQPGSLRRRILRTEPPFAKRGQLVRYRRFGHRSAGCGSARGLFRGVTITLARPQPSGATCPTISLWTPTQTAYQRAACLRASRDRGPSHCGYRDRWPDRTEDGLGRAKIVRRAPARPARGNRLIHGAV